MNNLPSKYLHFALELVEEGVIILDREGRILFTTDRAEKLLGLGIDLKGRALTELFPESILFKNMNRKLHSREEMLPVPTGDRNVLCLCRLEQVIEEGEIIANIAFLKLQKSIRNVKNSKLNSAIYAFNDIIGSSDKIEQLKITGKAFAQSDSTILIQGETGTGKELLAQALHSASSRKDKAFIPVNCAAIPENLLESELFGYEEGSFTGAKKGGKPGRFEVASGGTIFLDEIGDMPLFLQAKLLRVLQEKTVERIGSAKQIPIDVRIVAATHKDLEELVAEKKFRSDLFYRLNVLPLQVPSLRERKEDIYVLLEHFLKKHTVLAGKRSKRFSAKALNFFFNYSWPGNIRELENAIEYAVNLPTEKELFDLDSLPPHITGCKDSTEEPGIQNSIPDNLNIQYEENVVKVKEMELQQIVNAIDKYGHSTQGKKEAAKALGISLATLYRKLKELKEIPS